MIILDHGLHLYFKEASQYSLLTQEEECELATRVKQGDKEAKEILIKSNLRLVGFIAKKYLHRGIEYDDLIGYGNIGLMEAVERYNPEMGYRFTTYATWWIRRSITNAIYKKSLLVRLPKYVVIDIVNVKKIISQLIIDLGHEPTLEEIAASANMSTSKIRRLLKLAQTPVSLNKPVDQGHTGKKVEIGDFLTDEKQDLDIVIRAINQSEAKEKVLGIIESIETLSAKEIDIILQRSGLIDGRIRSLEEIGKEYKLTRERIKQILEEAFLKIKKSSQAYILAEYAENSDVAYKVLANIRRAKEKEKLNKKMIYLLRMLDIDDLSVKIFATKMGYAGVGIVTDAEIAESFFINEEKVRKIYISVLKAIKFSKHRREFIEEDPSLEELLKEIEGYQMTRGGKNYGKN